MLNEEKIRLMTQLSIYDKREGKAIREAGKYFRGTYISRRIFMAVVHYTLCFFLLTLLLMLMSLEQLLLHLNIPFMLAACRLLIFFYVIGMLLMAMYTYVRYAKQYDDIHRKSLFYEAKLEKLLAMAEGREEEETAYAAAPQENVKERRKQTPPSGQRVKPLLAADIARARSADEDGEKDWLDDPASDWPEKPSGIRPEKPKPEPEWLDDEPDWLDDPEEEDAALYSDPHGLQLMDIKRGTKA